MLLMQATINIERDEGPPEFQNLPYTQSIDHDLPVNSLVLVTSAIDRELRGQLMYEIVGDVPATSFFKLSSGTSGRILVRSNLRLDTFGTTRYLNYYNI